MAWLRGCIVQRSARSVVGGDDQRLLGICRILLGNHLDAFCWIGNLPNAPLPLKQLYASGHFSTGEVFDRSLQLRILLAHDLVKPHGFHAGFDQLLKRFSGLDALMLTGVANEENPVAGFELGKEFPNLFCAGKARFVDHI